ncbi:MAG: spore protease YyaC [Clostridiaceae bacterium]
MEKIILDSNSYKSVFLLRDSLCKILTPIIKSKKSVVFLSIGTDRSTGDSLGPLIGDRLKSLKRDGVYFYGSLENPVHAKNLKETLKFINKEHNKPFIIAIDASLGCIQNIGKIYLENKPICPGSALNKNLPKVGNYSITGIVNISGTLDFMVLQNTRLYTVMKLADIIYKGIYHSLLEIYGNKYKNNSPEKKYISLESLKKDLKENLV